MFLEFFELGQKIVIAGLFVEVEIFELGHLVIILGQQDRLFGGGFGLPFLRRDGLLRLAVNLKLKDQRPHLKVVAGLDGGLAVYTSAGEISAVVRAEVADFCRVAVEVKLAMPPGYAHERDMQIAIVPPADYGNVARQGEALLRSVFLE